MLPEIVYVKCFLGAEGQEMKTGLVFIEIVWDEIQNWLSALLYFCTDTYGYRHRLLQHELSARFKNDIP